jgi:hypothetical protein
MMNREQFNRFNRLSEKILNQTATPYEVKEFNYLLKEWNQSIEFNFINRVQLSKTLDDQHC